MTPDLSVKIGNVSFKNPIFVASGTFGYGLETKELTDPSALGAVVTKSITRHPREGNPSPRIVETPSGMINSIGLANMGVDAYINDVAPRIDQIGTAVITNIAGFSIDDYLYVMGRVEKSGAPICGYEINISCPNVEAGKMEFAVDPELTGRLTEALRKMTSKLLIVKLSPNVTDIVSIARAAKEGGADAVSAVNTVFGMSIDVSTREPHVHTNVGGLSGPAVRPVGVACVYKISRELNIPIIGIGGITSAKDAVEYMLAGASAVQVGTASFRHPDIGRSIIGELEQFLASNEIEDLSEITGGVIAND